MAVKDRTTKMANMDVTTREIDFVSRFSQRWQALMDLMSVSRPVQKQPGAVLTRKKGTITLQSGSVNEGDEIPYSLAGVVEDTPEPITIEKYAKGVSLEAINKHGYDVAIQKTDDAFLFELQKKVMDKFYTYLGDGNLTHVVNSGFQMGLAMAKGLVDNEFRKMKLESAGTVGFVNMLDFYKYLGGASITVQQSFGYNYIKAFMGYETLFLCSSDEVAPGKIYATAIENIVPYYVDPSDSDFARAGLEFTVDGDTPFIGFHTEGNYSHAVSESYAIMGLKLWAEYLNGIAVVDVVAAGTTIGSVTATSAAGTTSGTKLTVTSPDALQDDWTVKIRAASNPSAANYLEDISGWTTLTLDDDLSIDNYTAGGAKVVIAIMNATGQAIYTSSAITVTNHA